MRNCCSQTGGREEEGGRRTRPKKATWSDCGHSELDVRPAEMDKLFALPVEMSCVLSCN